MMKSRYLLAILAFLTLTSGGPLVQAQESVEVPERISLWFPDRTLHLNFKAQPELLTKRAKHYWLLASTKVPLDIEDQLLTNQDWMNIQTEFETVVSPSLLHEYFVASSIVNSQEGTPVEISQAEDGTINFTGRPNDGYEIDEPKLRELINEAIRTGQTDIRVPAEKVYSQVAVSPELQERGIQEVIAVGESNFSGSSRARAQNIRAATRKFNGAIIKKGRTFSFNEILESVAEKDGFVKELVIKGNETVKELGGGVCQVSTTAFRAAFSGGFPIKERKNHSYSVSYYKPFGLDAAIYLGAADLRFRNDTPGDILIQAFIDNEDLFFVFYGTKDERKITFEGPFISNYRAAPETIVYETEDLPQGEVQEVSEAHAGFRTQWIRKVENEGEINEDDLVSYYRPWPAKILRGIGDEVSVEEE